MAPRGCHVSHPRNIRRSSQPSLSPAGSPACFGRRGNGTRPNELTSHANRLLPLPQTSALCRQIEPVSILRFAAFRQHNAQRIKSPSRRSVRFPLPPRVASRRAPDPARGGLFDGFANVFAKTTLRAASGCPSPSLFGRLVRLLLGLWRTAAVRGVMPHARRHGSPRKRGPRHGGFPRSTQATAATAGQQSRQPAYQFANAQCRPAHPTGIVRPGGSETRPAPPRAPLRFARPDEAANRPPGCSPPRRPGCASKWNLFDARPLFHLTRAPDDRRPEVGIPSAWRGAGRSETDAPQVRPKGEAKPQSAVERSPARTPAANRSNKSPRADEPG